MITALTVLLWIVIGSAGLGLLTWIGILVASVILAVKG